MSLDDPNGSGRRGIIGYTRGRNEYYLPGALCEQEVDIDSNGENTLNDAKLTPEIVVYF